MGSVIARLKRWWYRRRLVDLLIESLEDGNGVSSQVWACGASSEEVLVWFDGQLAMSRTPYGLSGLKLVVLGEAGPPLYEVLLRRRREWLSTQRAEMAAVLTPLLAQRGVTTAVISFGTALHSVLGQSRS